MFLFCFISFNAFWKFLWLGNSAWDFLGVKFWSRDFLGFCLKPWDFFWVFIFASILSSLSLEIQGTPPWEIGEVTHLGGVNRLSYNLLLF